MPLGPGRSNGGGGSGSGDEQYPLRRWAWISITACLSMATQSPLTAGSGSGSRPPTPWASTVHNFGVEGATGGGGGWCWGGEGGGGINDARASRTAGDPLARAAAAARGGQEMTRAPWLGSRKPHTGGQGVIATGTAWPGTSRHMPKRGGEWRTTCIGLEGGAVWHFWLCLVAEPFLRLPYGARRKEACCSLAFPEHTSGP